MTGIPIGAGQISKTGDVKETIPPCKSEGAFREADVLLNHCQLPTIFFSQFLISVFLISHFPYVYLYPTLHSRDSR